MKKILCLVPYTFLPAKTGGQKSIASFYQNLSKHFVLVCIGTKENDAGKAEYKMINILSNSFLRYVDPFNFFRIRNIINKEKPDYLQIEHPYMGWLAVLLKKFTGFQLIVRSHNIEGLRFENLGKWWWKILLQYEKWVHRNADFSYFITETDRLYAIKKFNLKSPVTFTVTFGINQTAPPSLDQRSHAKAFLLEEHRLDTNDEIILFNGAFDYKPNRTALYHLVNTIFLLLKTLSNRSFKLIICGKDIPGDLTGNNLNPDIIYAGFVADIDIYLSGAKVFVNPITEGGGIKTKLVEALGFDLNCVSYETGAIGVDKEVCGEKLLIVEDINAEGFAKAIVMAAGINAGIPEKFYERFSNVHILQKITNIL